MFEVLTTGVRAVGRTTTFGSLMIKSGLCGGKAKLIGTGGGMFMSLCIRFLPELVILRGRGTFQKSRPGSCQMRCRCLCWAGLMPAVGVVVVVVNMCVPVGAVCPRRRQVRTLMSKAHHRRGCGGCDGRRP